MPVANPVETSYSRDVLRFFELLGAIAWKSVALRYKQAYLGAAWVVLKPMILVLIFVMLRSFVGIDSGTTPYPLLAYCALLPWVYFQETSYDGTASVVGHAAIIRKIYVPSEIFPLAAALTKLMDWLIGMCFLAAMMAWYGYGPQWSMVWVPLVILWTIASALAVAFVGSALNVYFRDMSHIVPLLMSFAMYASPVIYPLEQVRRKLLDEHVAGAWSDTLYLVYTINPMTGVIDTFQRVMLKGLAPDPAAALPGLILVSLALPASYLYFKRSEGTFADYI